MRSLFLLAACLMLASSPALSQETDGTRWTGERTKLSLVLPPAWSEDAKKPSGTQDIIHRKSAAFPDKDDAACFLGNRVLDGKGQDGKPLTQAGLNAQMKPLTVDAWLLVLEQTLGAKKITSIESLPSRIVDGKMATVATADYDSGRRIIIHASTIFTPLMIYSIGCMYITDARPGEETPAFRKQVADDFDTLLKTVRAP